MSTEGPSYPQDRPQDQPYQQPYQQPTQPTYQQPYAAAYPPPAYGPDEIRFQAAGTTAEHPQATLAFVLGLLSVLGLSILGPFGWYYGNKVVREIDRDGRLYTNRGIAMTGKVLGIIGTVFLGFVVLAFVALLAFGIMAAASA